MGGVQVTFLVSLQFDCVTQQLMAVHEHQEKKIQKRQTEKKTKINVRDKQNN